jgi:hypothetical protein
MKKMVAAIIFIFIAMPVLADTTIRVSPIYVMLSKPDLSIIKIIPGSVVKEGGFGAIGQVLIAFQDFNLVGESGYLPILDITETAEVTEGDNGASLNINATANAIPIIVALNFEVPADGKINLFFEGGLGFAIINTKIDIKASEDIPIIDSESSQNISKSDTSGSFVFKVGGGAALDLGKNFSLDLAVNHYTFFTKIEVTGSNQIMSLLSYGAGLAYQF